MKYLILIISLNIPYIQNAQISQCFGTTSNGRIEHAIQLPVKGKNFIIYNNLGDILGRNYVHSKVYEVVVNTYAEIYKEHPDIHYKYAETGWKNGAQFMPHKTHQNGLSVDFMVPVLDKLNQSVYFPTVVSNKFGYGIEFDSLGKYKSYHIDFEAIAFHLIELNKQAKKANIKVKRVIFAPEFRNLIFKTKNAQYLKENIHFMKNKAWVRHDEHYHVDFDISCEN